MNELEIAWAAGFFDGEGCVKAYQEPEGHFNLRLTVAGTDVRPLMRLQANFGGGVVRESRQTSSRNAIWGWSIHGAESERFAKLILDHTSVKYEQLELFIEFRSLIKNWGRAGCPPSIRSRQVVLARQIKVAKGRRLP